MKNVLRLAMLCLIGSSTMTIQPTRAEAKPISWVGCEGGRMVRYTVDCDRDGFCVWYTTDVGASCGCGGSTTMSCSM